MIGSITGVIALLALWCVYRVVAWVLFVLARIVLVKLTSGEEGGEVTLSTVTGVQGSALHSLARARLRRRSRWVRCLEAALDGKVGCVAALFAGRWTPDLPSVERGRVANFVAALSKDGVRITGGGSCRGKGDDGGSTDVPYLHIEMLDGTRMTVFPSLLAKLSNHAVFRTRNAALLALLRLRALEWRRDQGLDHCDLAYGLADSVCLASSVTSWEASASQWLAERGLAAKVDA